MSRFIRKFTSREEESEGGGPSGELIEYEDFVVRVSATKAVKPQSLVTPSHVMLVASQDRFPFWHDYSGTVSDEEIMSTPYDASLLPEYLKRSVTLGGPTLKDLAPLEWILPMEGTWRCLFYQPDVPVIGSKCFFDWSVEGESEATNIIYRLYMLENDALYFFTEDGVNGETNRDIRWQAPKIKPNRHYCVTLTRDATGVISAYINGIKLNWAYTQQNVTDTTGYGDFLAPATGGQDARFFGVVTGDFNEAIIRVLEMKSTHEPDASARSHVLNDEYTPEEMAFIHWDDFIPSASTVMLLEPDPVNGWIDHSGNNTSFEVTSPGYPLFDDRHVTDKDTVYKASLAANPHLHVVGDITIETVFFTMIDQQPELFVGPYVFAGGETEPTNYLFRHYLDSCFWEHGAGINAGGIWPNPLSIEDHTWYRSLFTVKDHGDGMCTAMLLLYNEDGGVQDSGELTAEMWSGGEAGDLTLVEDGHFYRYVHIKNEYTQI